MMMSLRCWWMRIACFWTIVSFSVVIAPHNTSTTSLDSKNDENGIQGIHETRKRSDALSHKYSPYITTLAQLKIEQYTVWKNFAFRIMKGYTPYRKDAIYEETYIEIELEPELKKQKNDVNELRRIQKELNKEFMCPMKPHTIDVRIKRHLAMAATKLEIGLNGVPIIVGDQNGALGVLMSKLHSMETLHEFFIVPSSKSFQLNYMGQIAHLSGQLSAPYDLFLSPFPKEASLPQYDSVFGQEQKANVDAKEAELHRARLFGNSIFVGLCLDKTSTQELINAYIRLGSKYQFLQSSIVCITTKAKEKDVIEKVFDGKKLIVRVVHISELLAALIDMGHFQNCYDGMYDFAARTQLEKLSSLGFARAISAMKFQGSGGATKHHNSRRSLLSLSSTVVIIIVSATHG